MKNNPKFIEVRVTTQEDAVLVVKAKKDAAAFISIYERHVLPIYITFDVKFKFTH